MSNDQAAEILADLNENNFEYEAPIGIDTPEDLEAAKIFAKQND